MKFKIFLYANILGSVMLFEQCGNDKKQQLTANSTSSTTSLIQDTSGTFSELNKTDEEFNDYLLTKGSREALSKYMSSNAVLLKANHAPLETKDSVIAFFEKRKGKDLKITRNPASAEISLSGDMAYVYGTYEASGTGLKGKPISMKGSYLTVWKKNTNNQWEIVMDSEHEGLSAVKKKKK